jgi:hypothetical protein
MEGLPVIRPEEQFAAEPGDVRRWKATCLRPLAPDSLPGNETLHSLSKRQKPVHAFRVHMPV